MTQDEHLAMHAVITKVSASANPKGVKTYKVAFSYPRAFMEYLDEVIGQPIDVYWDEALVLRNAVIKRMHQADVPDSDPIYVAELTCVPMDTELANLVDAVNNSGDLRISVPQGTLFAGPSS